MTEEDIEAVIAGFARCAKVLVNAGFTGVQLHAAHGYLLSQFLSPRSNQREDQWGGSLENRARLLLSCVARVRAAVGPAVPVSVKLNSADFQRGGFDFNESLQVAKWLEQASVDLIEISGGTYEQPRLLNLEGMEPVEEQSVAASTRAREAYFVDFAEAMRKEINTADGHGWLTAAGCHERRAGNRLRRYDRDRPADVRGHRCASTIVTRGRGAASFRVDLIAVAPSAALPQWDQACPHGWRICDPVLVL